MATKEVGRKDGFSRECDYIWSRKIAAVGGD